MEKVSIALILGTAREGQKSEHVAHFIFEELRKRPEVEAQFIDVKDFIYPQTFGPEMNRAETKPWSEIASQADGFIMVTPEYNHSFPGELKLLIDQCEQEYKKKVTGVVGISSGPLGGARVIEHLAPVLTYLKMFLVQPPLRTPNVENLFDEEGNLLDESYREKVKKFVDAVIELTQDIKEVREKAKK